MDNVIQYYFNTKTMLIELFATLGLDSVSTIYKAFNLILCNLDIL